MKSLYLFGFIILVSCGATDYEKYVRKNYPQKEFTGVVEKKYRIKQKNNVRVIRFKNYSEEYLDIVELYDFIQKGDLLIKEKGTVKFKVVRNADTFIFYPETDRWIIMDDTLLDNF